MMTDVQLLKSIKRFNILDFDLWILQKQNTIKHQKVNLKLLSQQHL